LSSRYGGVMAKKLILLLIVAALGGIAFKKLRAV
jgi:hypothetical protein